MIAVPASSPPRPSAVQWLRHNLFSSAFNTLLTFAAVALLAAALIPLLRWMVIDAQWVGTTPQTCANAQGACWPFVWSHLGQFAYGLYPPMERWRVNLGVGLGVALIVAIALLRAMPVRRWLMLCLFTVYPIGAGILFAGGIFGLPAVPTAQWGGFFLTLVVSFCVLSASLPIGTLLALGRRSKIPLLRAICTAWIEFWRAIPLVALLFVAIIMFPLFTPPGFEIDKLVRAMLALTVLMSAYLAEVVRGALQALPRGQYEAAQALGLSYPQTMQRIVLPQALSIAVPQIANQFIGLFKETTVLLIIGFFDLLGMVQTASLDPAWLGADSIATGYLFAATFFWICCFAMSRVSVRLERRGGDSR